MLSAFFGNKIEKEFKQLLKEAPELEIRYAGEEEYAVSRLRKVFRDSLIIGGFKGALRKKELEIRILSNMTSFKTEVIRTGIDHNGNPIFYVKIPAKLNMAGNAARKRFVIHPNGTVKILLSTNRGQKSLVLKIFDIGEGGISIVNDSKIGFKPGTKLFQTMITIGSMSDQLVDLLVANVKNRQVGDSMQQLLICTFKKQPRALKEMLSAAQSVAPKPKPAKN
ncbi:hypothetical protein [Acanthopleuribacter pedis]|uniref:PilZ domain-containing protein n=1 Tax=Acanthopleuribacter pedis TaxID=442870 RepID=A0A8J7U342_9BACT|nr:hypothetical protein [Acanthopleuribacter pedis]MBO1316881.1 hypothetical protein [Acanthopleuribacter pedis]